MRRYSALFGANDPLRPLTLAEFVHKIAVVLAGEDTPELYAYIDRCIAAEPWIPWSVTLPAEDFDAFVAERGGPEAMRREALSRGIATDELDSRVWLDGGRGFGCNEIRFPQILRESELVD